MKCENCKNKKKPMGRTIVVVDEETKRIWKKSARKLGISNSEYIRRLIQEDAEKHFVE